MRLQSLTDVYHLIFHEASWVSLQPLIVNKINPDASSRSKSAIALIAKLLFGIFLCVVVLLGEKISIQFIAKHFHEESYAGISFVFLRASFPRMYPFFRSHSRAKRKCRGSDSPLL